MQVSVCPNCNGNGEMISEYCRKCSGEGRIRVKKDIKVKIPPGVNKGSILRVTGEGDAGPKGYVSNDRYTLNNIIKILCEYTETTSKEGKDILSEANSVVWMYQGNDIPLYYPL